MVSAQTLIALVATASSLAAASAGSCGRTLINANFNRYGSNNFNQWNRDGALQEFPNGLRYTTAINRSSVGKGTLRVMHPKGCVGVGGCGMIFAVNLDEPVEEATLSFRVRFDSNYDWTAGGKLPGLCDADCPTGCRPTNSNQAGWSSRIMWREGGEMESYMYYPFRSSKGTCGEEWLTRGWFQSNKWHKVHLYVKMNNPGVPDGVQQIWLDGKQVFNSNSVRFRNEPGHWVKQLKFENFHGGKDDRFRPDKTQYVEFDDIMVQKGMCAPGPRFVEQNDKNPCPHEKRTSHFIGCGHPNDGNEGNEGRS